jgi:hypothetical protein
MDLQVAQSTAQAFQHGFSAGASFGLLFAGLYIIVRNWRRDP